MSQLSLTLPQIGQPDSSEDPKINTALTTIQTWANGSIDATNLTQAAATSAGLNTAGQTAKASFAKAGVDTTSSGTFVALAVPDQATVYVPSPGLLYVGYRATWNVLPNNTALAAIFIDGVELQVAMSAGPSASGGATRASMTASNTGGQNTPLSTYQNGLVSLQSQGTTYSGDVTTGMVLGISQAQGICIIENLPSGNHTVQIRFSTTGGQIAVTNRRLYVKAEAYS